MNKLIGSFFCLLILGSCAAPEKRPVPGPGAPAPVPTLEKTYGDMQMDANGAVLIQYKAIRMVIDPAPSTVWDSAQTDYVLLTRTPTKPLNARKDIKIMAPPTVVAALQAQGFSQVKGVTTGQRLYLKKDADYLFAGAVSSAVSEEMRNGYFFEFDNGRNIYVSERLASLGGIREFVFSLRDDGREVNAAIISAETPEAAAEAIALLQPQFAYYDAASAPVDRKKMDKMLKDQLYEGVFSFLKPGQIVPF